MFDLGARATVAGWLVACAAFLGGCGSTEPSGDDDPGNPFGGMGGGGSGDDVTPPQPTPMRFDVQLVPDGATGTTRVNFAIPLSAGALTDATRLRVLAGTTELAAATRALALHGDGSVRSVQVQIDADAAATLTVELDVAGMGGLSLVPVEGTLAGAGNNVHPRVWAVLPATVLAASGVVGPVIPETEIAGTALDAWSELCDYGAWDTDAFLVSSAASRDVWLYDRVTAMYRGYATTGDADPLRSAYREAAIYRAGMVIANGVTTAIAVPNASTDLKYFYSQGMALHYLMTGDDRYREAAEAVSAKIDTMWDPDYDGTDEFWTERHAGFALLAHESALMVTDDQATAITARADEVVAGALAAQSASRFGQSDPDARCFAHTAAAHGEAWSGNGCSPWMSAILADGLDAHARRVGGTRATEVRTALGRLAKAIARNGLDGEGRPLYWMGVGTSSDEVDPYEEHWGESAYVVALGWASTGRTDAELRTAADALVAGLRTHGEVGQVRSFNWQCRSAVMTPALLH
jgi:hypothetical protein